MVAAPPEKPWNAAAPSEPLPETLFGDFWRLSWHALGRAWDLLGACVCVCVCVCGPELARARGPGRPPLLFYMYLFFVFAVFL